METPNWDNLLLRQGEAVDGDAAGLPIDVGVHKKIQKFVCLLVLEIGKYAGGGGGVNSNRHCRVREHDTGDTVAVQAAPTVGF